MIHDRLHGALKRFSPGRGGLALRFAIVGGINTLLGLFLFPVLQTLVMPWHVHYMVTLCVTQAMCVISSFLMLRHFVFRVQQTSFVQFLLHSAFHWTYFAFNLLALPMIVEFYHQDPRIVQFGISFVAMLLSFVWQSRVVFKSR